MCDGAIGGLRAGAQRVKHLAFSGDYLLRSVLFGHVDLLILGMGSTIAALAR
jgi:hypothetical protein